MDTIDDRTVGEYFRYVYAKDLESERFAMLAENDKAERVARGMATCRETLHRLYAAIASKDIKQLKLMIHADNRFFRRVFENVTGMRVDGFCTDRLREFVGPEAWDAYHADKAAQAEREKAERAAKSKRDALEDELSTPVQWSGGQGTNRDWIEWMIAEGFSPQLGKRGFARSLSMVRNGNRYVIHKANVIDYILQRLNLTHNTGAKR